MEHDARWHIQSRRCCGSSQDRYGTEKSSTTRLASFENTGYRKEPTSKTRNRFQISSVAVIRFPKCSRRSTPRSNPYCPWKRSHGFHKKTDIALPTLWMGLSRNHLLGTSESSRMGWLFHLQDASIDRKWRIYGLG